ncbi:endogenous retrovirus group FC1 Env polyprotein [Peromyscus leucopus]|uniref:endogenous retrovirus group FC1 Env polyprotein n=1 Tax=Peromyscus leucopus TaxID=10041 RepID=UPI0010A15C0D|nr:endogenous retrovirus group FC1 Env polyprotein [Peromyscus leucopus]
MYTARTATWPSSRLYIWRSYVQVQLRSIIISLHKKKKLMTQISSPSSPFSCLFLLREGLMFANVTGIGNLSSCFLCAALGRPPLIAVPLPQIPNCTTTDNSHGFHPIPEVPLFLDPGCSKFDFCFSSVSLPFCNQTVLPNHPFAPPGFFFRCKVTLSKNLTIPIPQDMICLPVTLVPQLMPRTPADFLRWDLHQPKQKRAVFLPLVAGISLATSLVSAGLVGGVLGHSLITTAHLSKQLRVAIEDSAVSLSSLQRQLTSLAQVAIQNRWALDLLTAEKGGTCLFLGEECCYYINESGMVETQINKLHKLSLELHKQHFSAAADDWWKSSMFSLLMPLAEPLVSIVLFVTLGPFIIGRLIRFIKKQIDSLASKPVQVHYHPLEMLDRGCDP